MLDSAQQKTLAAFKKEVQVIVDDVEYDELFGYQLSRGEFFDEEAYEKLLIKLLTAYDCDLQAAEDSLEKILEWRKEFDPLSAAFVEDHGSKFDDIGFITYDPDGKPLEKVVTWNLYGKVKNAKEIFGTDESDTSGRDAFLRWRVGLMEQSVQLLDFKSPGNDYMVQVHDYKGVSLFQRDAQVKKTTKKVIEVFRDFYPELLSKKFFVNVPTLMMWVFNVIKPFVAEKTRNKFVVLSNGSDLAKHLDPKMLGAEYGGQVSKGTQSLKFLFKESKAKYTAYTAHLVGQRIASEID
ncbi:hypothetical protein KL930_004817 [Ogataea haglerorum]|uniref:Phosphatidylinositol transfer protein SFH5 n=1 Tax=Ogataea haglerorum TaxID=1937702 RepID=A0AAN6HZG6_9ASCO|nr:uncharacterized protein KL911_004547 [Ogataea haglerorum]KAG7693098.1 hypothetical protein KL951_004637 [Ogataea haglerorum]KAG7724754.1 hypothetical protein KL933_004576 [Ogataea haglerorum]KAG7745978.1 hypothetical protein KL912_004834 [Ogataea haglerorum]KAG7751673.1 hypothetical protein KL911_004547 [Ogataea haglerorum]KAG7773034.1 hypothetical protein KL930_004817 [Ogataea haglerorum]